MLNFAMMSNPIHIGIMKNMLLKNRYETPEAELLELFTEDFILYGQNDNSTPSGEGYNDGEYPDTDPNN